jgi:hypothetical protein
MENLRIILSVLYVIVFGAACGTIEVAEPQDEQKDKTKEESEEEGEEFNGVEVETTTTTSTKVKVGGVGADDEESDGRPHEVRRFELRNDFAANKDFVSGNFCSGSAIRDCWLRSGLLSEFSDGTFSVSLEFWDSYDSVPYVVKEADIPAGGDRAVLLTDKGKIAGDDTVQYRHIWAVVVPDVPAVGIYYDWLGDGPGQQGDDLLESLEFFEIED